MVNERFPLKLSSASKLSTGGHQSRLCENPLTDWRPPA